MLYLGDDAARVVIRESSMPVAQIKRNTYLCIIDREKK